MTEPGPVTITIEDCLRRIEGGDESAMNELIDCAYDRLVAITESLVGKMAVSSQGIRASDVFQSVYLRLSTAIRKDNVNPKTVGEFLGLASRHIRFQVLDMLRVLTRNKSEELQDPRAPEKIKRTEMWICFFEAFENLPEDEKAVADLLWTWVDGKGGSAVPNMTQSEAAAVLNTNRDKVKDLWRSARIRISKSCKEFGDEI